MKKLLLASAALAALSTGAMAADLGAPRMPVATAIVMPSFSWTGFYVGGQVGYGWGKAQQPFNFPATANTFPIAQGAMNQSGVLGGLHAGYLHQFGSVVLGVEADIEASGVTGNDRGAGGVVNGLKHRWDASLRLRGGVAIDRVLVYATGGLAYLNASASDALFVQTVNTNFTGFTVGAGLEYAFTPNVSARVEYRYTDYGKTTARFTTGDYATRINPQIHAVRVGLSYHFSTGASAVVARY